MVCRGFFAAFLFFAAASGPAHGGTAKETALLPPAAPWNGKSRELIAAANDPWITPAEASGFRRTPSYDETMAWLDRLDAASDELAIVTLGRSPEGREIRLVIASAEHAATPEALAATGKPALLAQAGIHAGEIDGKDAGLMLLRDLVQTRRKHALLERANLLFIPIFNVDGHERSGPFTRINQRGPENGGFRTTARNLNLNRDYTKLDAPETRALVAAINRYRPTLYLDLHVTDGADYQYDITYGWNGPQGYSPAISAWLSQRLGPALDSGLSAEGHIPGPFINLIEPSDLARGNFAWMASARFSNGYGDVRHLPSVLVENHSLKPYDQRVLGTYVLLATALRTLGEEAPALRKAIATDEAQRPNRVPLAWSAPQGPPTATMVFRGIKPKTFVSEVTGAPEVEWTGEPVTLTVPVVEANQPSAFASRPRFYYVPPAFEEVITRLRAHGIAMETLSAPTTAEVEMYRLEGVKLAGEAFEGHVAVTAKAHLERRRETFPRGTVRISTDQPLGDLAVVLLEPDSQDSFFQWGFFPEILQPTEYVEGYIMAPMAAAMLREDPVLAKEFAAALAADPAFAANPRERLAWFYRRTPFKDDRHLLYPVARQGETP